MPISSAGCYLCFWPTGCKSEVPTTPSVGSLHLLEQLIDLRKPVHSLATGLLQRILKDTDQQSDDKIYRAIRSQATEPCPCGVWGPARWHMEAFWLPKLEAFWTQSFWVFMEASLHMHGWLNHWPLTVDSTSTPSLYGGRDVWGWKFQACNHVLVLQATWVLVPKSSH